MKKLFLILIILSSFVSEAINIDSLDQVWSNTKLHDTTRLNAINAIASDGYLYSNPKKSYYYSQLQYEFSSSKKYLAYMAQARKTQATSLSILGEFDSSLVYLNESFRLYTTLNNTIGIANTFNSMGHTYFDKGDFTNALKFYKKGLSINLANNSTERIAVSTNNIGNVYYYQGNYSAALENYASSLDAFKNTNNKKQIAKISSNIGMIYDLQKHDSIALYYYNKSLKVIIELGDSVSIAECLNNIAETYAGIEDYISAIHYHNKGLSIRRKIVDKKGIAISLINLGIIYKSTKNYSKSKSCFKEGLMIGESIENDFLKTYALIGLSEVYFLIGNNYKENKMINQSISHYDSTLYFGREGYNLATEIDAKDLIKNASKILAAVYEEKGFLEKSLEMYKTYHTLYISLENLENKKKIIEQQSKYEYNNKIDAANLIFVQENKLKDLNYRYNTIFLIGLLIFLVTLVVVFFKLKFSKIKTEKAFFIKEIKTLKLGADAKNTLTNSLGEKNSLSLDLISEMEGIKLNNTDKKILNLLFVNPSLSNKELAEKIFLSIEGTRSSLRKMYKMFEIKTSRNQRFALIMKVAKLSSKI